LEQIRELPKEEFKVKGLLGLVPQEIALYQSLTAFENVSFFASLYGLRSAELKEAANEALDFVGLSGDRKKRAGKLSGGQRRRLNIACGIAHRPELIIMDEPTVGVDARSRDHILSSIKTLRERGATIIYTSHYMPEVQALADRIAIIDKGRLAAIGTENELLEYVTDRKSLTIGIGTQAGASTGDSEGESALARRAADEARALPGVKSAGYDEESGSLKIDVELSLGNVSPILKRVLDLGLTISTIEEESANLETTFLALTGTELNRGAAAAGEAEGESDGKGKKRGRGLGKGAGETRKGA
jgi:ABC-2 type transport system ATP-binding protein